MTFYGPEGLHYGYRVVDDVVVTASHTHAVLTEAEIMQYGLEDRVKPHYRPGFYLLEVDHAN